MLFTLIYKAIILKLVIKADIINTEFNLFVFKPEILKFNKIFILKLYYKDI